MVRWGETDDERSEEGPGSLLQVGSSGVPLYLAIVCTLMSALILS